jgi:hypothetical protein
MRDLGFRGTTSGLWASKNTIMLRVYADFNDRTNDGDCWNLWYGNTTLEKRIDELGLVAGDKVKLYQDENDFEVIAALDYRYIDILERAAWVAVPDWSTVKRSW